MTDEKLIKEADDEGFALAALAVFEKAHTPTDEEREALLDFLSKGEAWQAIRGMDAPGLATELAAAGFRRSEVPEPSAAWHDVAAFLESKGLADGGIADFIRENAPEPQGEPSDAQVEAAARTTLPLLSEAWLDYGYDGVTLPNRKAELNDAFRAGLKAAGGVQ